MAAILSYEASEYCIVGSCLNCKSYTFRRFVPFQYLLCKCVSFKITEDNLVELFHVFLT